MLIKGGPLGHGFGLQTLDPRHSYLGVLVVMGLVLGFGGWLLLGYSLVQRACYDGDLLVDGVRGFGAELQNGLAKNLHVNVIGTIVSVRLEEAVVDPLVLAAAHGGQDGALGTDPLLGERGCLVGQLVMGEGAAGGVGAHGWSPAGAPSRLSLLVVVKVGVGLLLVGCHLFQLLSMRHLWPAGQASRGDLAACLLCRGDGRGGKGGASHGQGGPSGSRPELR